MEEPRPTDGNLQRDHSNSVNAAAYSLSEQIIRGDQRIRQLLLAISRYNAFHGDSTFQNQGRYLLSCPDPSRDIPRLLSSSAWENDIENFAIHFQELGNALNN